MTDAARTTAIPAFAVPEASQGESRWRIVARNAFPFLVVGTIWEIVARLGIFPRKLFPPLEEIAATFIRLTADGILPHHVFDTLLRLTAGFALAAVVGVVIGIAMGRWKLAEDVFVPLVSIGASAGSHTTILVRGLSFASTRATPFSVPPVPKPLTK